MILSPPYSLSTGLFLNKEYEEMDMLEKPEWEERSCPSSE